MTTLLADVYKKAYGDDFVAERIVSMSPENVQIKRMIRTLLYKQGRASLRQIAEAEATITGKKPPVSSAIHNSIHKDDYMVRYPDIYEDINDIIIDVFSF